MGRYGDWYDVAQICLNGHVVNSMSKEYSNSNRDFCETCGKKTITHCEKCNNEIKGYHHMENVHASYGSTPPSYCPDCGEAYPWTISKINALKELTNELDEISEDEKNKFKESIDDIVIETPKTNLASSRFKLILNKISPEHRTMIKDMGLNLLCESAKKLIWGEMAG